MAVNNIRVQPGYSLNQPLTNIPYGPIVSARSPLATDLAPIGQQWVQPSTNSVWFLASIVASLGTWVDVSNGAGAFTSLAVTTFITAGTTITAGTGIVSTTGNIVATAGEVNAGTSISAGTSITAAGVVAAGTAFDFTGGPTIIFGAGAPTVAAAQGSLYLNTTGSSTTTRLYVNTNGTTGWTDFITTA